MHRRRFGRRRYAKVGGHPYGRFCVSQVGAVPGGHGVRNRGDSPIGIGMRFAGTPAIHCAYQSVENPRVAQGSQCLHCSGVCLCVFGMDSLAI